MPVASDVLFCFMVTGSEYHALWQYSGSHMEDLNLLKVFLEKKSCFVVCGGSGCKRACQKLQPKPKKRGAAKKQHAKMHFRAQISKNFDFYRLGE